VTDRGDATACHSEADARQLASVALALSLESSAACPDVDDLLDAELLDPTHRTADAWDRPFAIEPHRLEVVVAAAAKGDLVDLVLAALRPRLLHVRELQASRLVAAPSVLDQPKLLLHVAMVAIDVLREPREESVVIQSDEVVHTKEDARKRGTGPELHEIGARSVHAAGEARLRSGHQRQG
jgi:hypothetical protein